MAYLYYKKIIVSNYYKVSEEQVKYFFVAACLFYIVKGSPLTVIADQYLFSAHIFELAIVFFAILPLLILSMPTELLRKYFWDYRLRNIIKIFAHPWIAAIIFNGALTIYLVPTFFNQIQQSVILSFISQVVLVLTAIIMWWTIIVPVPGVTRFSYFARVAFVFLNAILLLPIGFFLLLTMNQAYYPVYEAAAYQIFPSLSAIYDQQLGGGILKSIQLLSYGTALFYLISRWAKEEEEREDENIRVVQGIVIQLPEKK
nr:cytochrome c oxidase assembly protein [Bacillus sp. FJAT-50079]